MIWLVIASIVIVALVLAWFTQSDDPNVFPR